MNNTDALLKAIEWCNTELNQLSIPQFRAPYLRFRDFLVSLQSQQPLKEDEVELLASKVHDSWQEEKRKQGFHPPSCCPSVNKEMYNHNSSNIKVDDELRTKWCDKCHPDMYPYHELSENIKEYDRVTVRTVLKAQSELQSLPNINNEQSGLLNKAATIIKNCRDKNMSEEIVQWINKYEQLQFTPVNNVDEEYKTHERLDKAFEEHIYNLRAKVNVDEAAEVYFENHIFSDNPVINMNLKKKAKNYFKAGASWQQSLI